MKTSKNWLWYAVYLLILAGYIIGAYLLLSSLRLQMQRTFNNGPFFLVESPVLVVFGVLLGLDHFLKERKKSGKWKANTAKLLLLGLPSAYLIFCRMVGFLDINFIVPGFLFRLLFSENYLPVMVAILFGYTMITGFSKVEAK